MTAAPRGVTAFPLAELRDDAGPVAARRGRRMGDPDIQALLGYRTPVQFVVAEADGRPPRWVPLADAHAFWRIELRPRIVTADAVRFDADSYPGRYCYVATEWLRDVPDAPPLVLLERHR